MDIELWRPRVGDRVRIQATVRVSSLRHELPHSPAERGHAGIVVDDCLHVTFPSHAYRVAFDTPIPIVSSSGGLMPLYFRHYAADELEPLEEMPDEGRATVPGRRPRSSPNVILLANARRRR